MKKEKQVIKIICDYYHVGLGKYELNLHDRSQPYALIRQWIMFFMKQYTKKSLREIGEICKKDHSTCLHSVRYIKTQIEISKKFEEIYNDLDKKVFDVFITPPKSVKPKLKKHEIYYLILMWKGKSAADEFINDYFNNYQVLLNDFYETNNM